MRREYQITFDIDTTEHDKQIRANVIDECIFKLAMLEDAMLTKKQYYTLLKLKKEKKNEDDDDTKV